MTGSQGFEVEIKNHPLKSSYSVSLRIHVQTKRSFTFVRLPGLLGYLKWSKTKIEKLILIESSVNAMCSPTRAPNPQLLTSSFGDAKEVSSLRRISAREMPCVRRWYDRCKRINKTWKLTRHHTFTSRDFRQLMKMVKMVPFWVRAEEVRRVAKSGHLQVFRDFADLVVLVPKLCFFSEANISEPSESESEISEDCLVLELPSVDKAWKIQSKMTNNFLLFLRNRLAGRNLEVNDVQISKLASAMSPTAQEIVQREFTQISKLISVVVLPGRRPKLNLSPVVHRRMFTNYARPRGSKEGRETETSAMKMARNGSQECTQDSWWYIAAEEESIIGLDKLSNCYRSCHKDHLARESYYELETHVYKSALSVRRRQFDSEADVEVDISYHANVRFHNESNPTNLNFNTPPIRQVRQFHPNDPPMMVGRGTHDFVACPARSCFKPGTSVGWQFANLLYPLKKRHHWPSHSDGF